MLFSCKVKELASSLHRDRNAFSYNNKTVPFGIVNLINCLCYYLKNKSLTLHRVFSMKKFTPGQADILLAS